MHRKVARRYFDPQQEQGFPTYIKEMPEAWEDAEEGLHTEVPPPSENNWTGPTNYPTPVMPDYKEIVARERVLAAFYLETFPYRLTLQGKTAAKVEDILQGLDDSIISAAEGVTLTRVDHQRESKMLIYRAEGSRPYTVIIRAVPPEGARQRHYWEADVTLACSCPFWRYGGCEYHADRGGYLYQDPRGTLGEPKIRDPSNNNFICKHMYKALQQSRRIYFDHTPRIL
jgi:hypothetical protein